MKVATNLVYVWYGNFRRVLVGRVGALELAVSEHVRFMRAETVIRAILRSDLAIEQESALMFTDTLIEG